MADIWSGDILLDDNAAIKEIILASQTIASSPAIPANALRFLSTVDTARIPLYLAAGPSLDVWTTSEDTQKWFESLLLSKPACDADAPENARSKGWWTSARSQSPIGILVQVESQVNTSESPRITELLFYGTVAASGNAGLPTPPSSSPDQLPAQSDGLPELRVHALPLSSDLLHRSDLPVIPPPSPALSTSEPHTTQEPRFLPSKFSAAPLSADSPKRKRNIFDEAEHKGRKARRKGGEGVAAAAAKAVDTQQPIGHRKSLSIDTKATPFPDFRPASAGGALTRPPSRALSRSPSISSDTRPPSRRGLPDGQTKRSTLSQVATVPLQPEEPTMETRNKEALSRVVLAAMRMYGLQQRKKNKSRRGSVAPGIDVAEQLSAEAAAEEAVKDEEYKVIYHQTYKGAALALRKHISTKPLHLQPDRLRDVVEKLLAIFCTDPLTQSLPSEECQNLLATPGQKALGIAPAVSGSQGSPFDLPSGQRVGVRKPKQLDELNTGSPVCRRKMKEVLVEPV